VYSVFGIPIARLAERWNRVNIITICLTIWSGMTALCGTAHSFMQLFVYRIGVGIGEAGCTPPAHSLITDYYPPGRRATAIAVYSFGIPLGTLLGATAGGWIAQNLDWRTAFLIVGLPGLILAVIAKLTLREPPRGYSEPGGPVAAHLQSPPPTLLETTRFIFSRSSLRHLTAAFTLTAFGSYALNAFTPPYFIRVFGLNFTQVGLITGVVGGVAVGVGTLAGGALADWAAQRDRRWYAWVPAIGVLAAAPLYAWGYTRDSWLASAAFLLIPGVFFYVHLGPTYAALHDMIEPRMRATAVAIVLLILGILGLGGGPLFAGMVIDHYSVQMFAAQGLGDFVALCPGGVAADPIHADACRSTLAGATRYSLLASIAILLWASLHYFLAARALRADMQR
jgi:predicted MFS family arabinose efflux permease